MARGRPEGVCPFCRTPLNPGAVVCARCRAWRGTAEPRTGCAQLVFLALGSLGVYSCVNEQEGWWIPIGLALVLGGILNSIAKWRARRKTVWYIRQ